MQTRKILASALYEIEERTEGWYFRPRQTDEDWNGPHRNVGAIAEEMADELEEQMLSYYEFRYNEAPP
jgi:hypothetical protein